MTEINGSTSDGNHTFDELYEYRLLYNAALFNEWAKSGRHPVSKSWRHSDGDKCFGGGWFVVTAQLPAGQITNHYPADSWNLFRIPDTETAPDWDGHTPRDVTDRLRALLTKPVAQTATAYPEHDKMADVHDKSQAIGEFVDWLSERGYVLATVQGARLVEGRPRTESLLAKFFGIDLEVVEQEKRAMLDQLRAANGL